MCGDVCLPGERLEVLKLEAEMCKTCDSIQRNPTGLTCDAGMTMRFSMQQLAEVLSESHWLTARCHELLISFDSEMDSFVARDHHLAVLRFLDLHLMRSSMRRGMILKSLGNLELRLGNRMEA